MNISLKYVACVATAILLSFGVSAQKQKKSITTTFWVAGICGQCEEVIEKTMDARGVINADYVLATNQLTVTYNPKKITEDQLHSLLNDAGYDTEKSTCTTTQYNKVHDCCRYRELEKH